VMSNEQATEGMQESPKSPSRTPAPSPSRPKTSPKEEYEPEPVHASAEKLDKAFNATRKIPPSYSMRGKPAMISGDSVPSWVKSIPGPKYNVETNAFKPRSPAYGFSRANERQRDMKRAASAPAGVKPMSNESADRGYKCWQHDPPKWTMGIKPDMVIGGTVPSWTKQIPGPKYLYDTNQFMKRQPVFTLGEKLDMVVGGVLPSWVNSIPGPKYTYNTDTNKPRQPVYTIGEKLPTEGEIMSKRSPGPIYEGPVNCATKQSLVDSTKKRTCAPSFGIGSRFEGKSAAMIRSGVMGRFEHGKFAYG